MKTFLFMITANAVIASLYFTLLVMDKIKRMLTHIKGRSSPG
jgi:hypothetical protein